MRKQIILYVRTAPAAVQPADVSFWRRRWPLPSRRCPPLRSRWQFRRAPWQPPTPARCSRKSGDHKITQPEVDAKIKIQLYDARKQALDEMVDDYLLEQAAKKEKLSVADYVKREVDDKAEADVNDAIAKKFYDENKDKIPALKSAGSYDKIKDRLVAALRQRDAQQQHEQLMARLRKEGDAKILLEAPRINVNLCSAGHPTLGPEKCAR